MLRTLLEPARPNGAAAADAANSARRRRECMAAGFEDDSDVRLCEFDTYEWSEKVFALGSFDVLIHEVVLDSFCIDVAASSKLSWIIVPHCPV